MARLSKLPSAENAAERAYTFILNKTINFGFLPGERINEVELAAHLGMSRAPVREALNRLVARELVMFESGKGFYCRKLSTMEVIELFDVRSMLEKASIVKTMAAYDRKSIDLFVEKWGNFKFLNENDSVSELIEADENFHIDLTKLAKNEECVKILRNISERMRFIRRIRIESQDTCSTFIKEHKQILAALQATELNTILQVMDKHFFIDPEELRVHINEGLARIYASEIA
jgi:DNA-binding GntR family transcriptional regulator